MNSAVNPFLSDAIEGLNSQNKYLPSKYFYDTRGSALFEDITRLDVYYPTRVEIQIMRDHGAEVAARIGHGATLVEYGSGSGEKTQILLDFLDAPKEYAAVEISASALDASVESLKRAHPNVEFHAILADYTRPFDLPFAGLARKIVYFPGSTIGNFKPESAVEFLRLIRRQVGDRGGLLIGVDLKKDPAILHAAYNDPQGVTAEFNLNVLDRINRELGADFDRDRFYHYAYYATQESRVEMHLVSACDQTVKIGAHTFEFSDGEPIVTEYSYKYAPAEFAALAAQADLEMTDVWTDDDVLFGVFFLRAV